MELFFLPFVSAAIISLFLTWLLVKFAPRFGLVDNPKISTHPAILHDKPVPTGAGLVFWASTVPVILVNLPPEKRVVGIAAGLTIAAVIGVLDDRFNLNPYLRLVLNFTAAAVIVAAGVGITFITNPLGGIIRLDTIALSFDFLGQFVFYPLAAAFALFWIVFVANMLNWSSGVDGQIPGIIVITAIVLAILSTRFASYDPNQIQLIKLAAILAGSAVGFLIFNWHPAKIFPGYGVIVWGMLTATLAILAGAKVATAILILAVPFADGVATIARRVLAGRSPVWGDRGHLHHLLLAAGFSQPKIALLYWAITLILGFFALNLSSSAKAFVITLVLVLVVGAILWLNFILTEKS